MPVKKKKSLKELGGIPEAILGKEGIIANIGDVFAGRKKQVMGTQVQQPAVGTQVQQPKEEEKLPQLLPLPAPKIIRDQNTGRISGVQLPSGQTIMGIGEADINAIMGKQAPQPTPAGAVEARDLAFQEQQQQFQQGRQQQALQLMQQLQGQQMPQAAPSELSPANAIISALTQAGIGAAGGALTGAVAGGGTPLSIGLGALGAVAGALRGFRQEMGQQLQGEISAAAKSLFTLSSDMNKDISLVNSGDSIVGISAFYQSYGEVLTQYSQLKQDHQRFLAKAVGKDATKQLEQYENFVSFTFPILERKLQMAIIQPNPNAIEIQQFIEQQDI